MQDVVVVSSVDYKVNESLMQGNDMTTLRRSLYGDSIFYLSRNCHTAFLQVAT